MANLPTFPLNTRVLVIDDDGAACQIIAEGLHKLGYQDVTLASDGAIAWEMIVETIQDQRPFQLIISDLEMEEVSGVELLRRIRTDTRTKGIPFIMLTAHSDLSAVLNSVNASVDDYIVKPFRLETLYTKLHTVYMATRRLK